MNFRRKPQAKVYKMNTTIFFVSIAWIVQSFGDMIPNLNIAKVIVFIRFELVHRHEGRHSNEWPGSLPRNASSSVLTPQLYEFRKSRFQWLYPLIGRSPCSRDISSPKYEALWFCYLPTRWFIMLHVPSKSSQAVGKSLQVYLTVPIS